MSYLSNIIEELCPDGVEWKRVSEITKVLRGKRLTKSKLIDEGIYPVYHGGLDPLGYYDDHNREAETVMIINVGASAGTVGYSKKDFWSSDGCYCLERTGNADSRFLYFALQSREQNLVSSVRKAGIPTLDAKVIESTKIPLPPLPAQREIVRILDNFTELTAELTMELTTELELRKKQYAYYRDKLLAFEGEDVEWVTLGEIAILVKDRISADLVDAYKYVGVENLLQDKRGARFPSSSQIAGNLIEYKENDILIGNIRPYLKKIWYSDRTGGTNGDVLVFRSNNTLTINPRFLFHCLASDNFFNFDMNFAKGSKMPRGDKKAVMNYKIPLPAVEEQERIVSILDKFDALVNDLNSGIPAEIEGRKKQYEYYRDKLLAFERC